MLFLFLRKILNLCISYTLGPPLKNFNTDFTRLQLSLDNQENDLF